MRPPRVALGLILAATLAHMIGHAQVPAAGPTFDVVSIKPSPPQTGDPVFRINAVTERPDGGVTIAQAIVQLLIASAYPGTDLNDMVGLPRGRRTTATTSAPRHRSRRPRTMTAWR